MPVAKEDHKRLRMLLVAAREDWKGELPERDRLQIIEALKLAKQKLPAANRRSGRRKGEPGRSLPTTSAPPSFVALLRDYAKENDLGPVSDEKVASCWARYQKSRPGSADDPGR